MYVVSCYGFCTTQIKNRRRYVRTLRLVLYSRLSGALVLKRDKDIAGNL